MTLNIAKYSLKTAALAVAIAAASVSAAEQATLQIKGTITPTACGISLSDGGVLDYGTITGDMLGLEPLNLPEKAMNVRINCDAEAAVAHHIIDNRAGTAAHSNNTSGSSSYTVGTRTDGGKLAYSTGANAANVLGLGSQSNGKPIGASYLVAASLAGNADGKTTKLIAKSNDANWAYVVSGSQLTSGVRQWSREGAAGSITPGAYTTTDFDYRVLTTLAPRDTFDLTSAVNIDGNATFSVVYL